MSSSARSAEKSLFAFYVIICAMQLLTCVRFLTYFNGICHQLDYKSCLNRILCAFYLIYLCIDCLQICLSMAATAAVWESCTFWYQVWLYHWPLPCCSFSSVFAETTRKPHVHQHHASSNLSVARTWRCPCSQPTNQR